jgi:hypothetical protein
MCARVSVYTRVRTHVHMCTWTRTHSTVCFLELATSLCLLVPVSLQRYSWLHEGTGFVPRDLLPASCAFKRPRY